MKMSLQDGRWSSIVSRLSAVADLEATARAFGALKRVRKVRRAEDLLRLALLYGPGQLSLRSTAAVAADGAVVALSDKAVMGRLRKMGDWLEHLLQCLLEQQRGLACGDALRVSLIDGSVLCAPGSTGTDWRLHARFDPACGRFTDLVLTRGDQGERVDRVHLEPGQTVIQDRGYARVRDFAAVLAARADFITRTGWNALRLLDDDNQRIDMLALLPADDAVVEHRVRLNGLDAPLRLVIQRMPDAAAQSQRKRVTRRASKNGHQLDPRTLTASGYMMLVTSLPAARVPAERIVQMYRDRWQIELGFKRLKTLGNLDRVPASDPDLARTWLLAHLIAAVLTDEIASEIVGFPPSARP
ncbi:MAG TPA: IS4 family transposase [Mycobacterium sp.]